MAEQSSLEGGSSGGRAEALADARTEDRHSDGFEVHVLKTWPDPFAAVRARKKTLEIRLDDRNFKEGDTLWLEEYDPATDAKSGEVEVRIVTHVLPGGQFGIQPGFVAMSIGDIPAKHSAADGKGGVPFPHTEAPAEQSSSDTLSLVERQLRIRNRLSIADWDYVCERLNLAAEAASRLEQVEAENARLREGRLQAVEFRPELIADPFRDEGGENKANASERLRLAYVIQQKCVPDQMAMVWRRDLGTQRHDLLRQTALADVYRRTADQAEFLLALLAQIAMESRRGN